MLLAACGGGGGSSSGGGTGTGGGTTTPPPTTTDPCATALLADTTEPAIGNLAPARPPIDKKSIIDGDPRGRRFEAAALNKWADERRRNQQIRDSVDATSRGGQQPSITSPAPVADDIGDIAVIQDTGDLILPLNPFDVRSTGLRFARNGATYNLSKIDGAFRSALGTRVTLGDDDSVQVNIPFSFPFYGNGRNVAFINSDGNITLEEEDKSSTERNLGRLVTGPPRIAPFFADLDPTMGSSKIFVNAAADQYTVTWCNVRGFDSTRTATVQATLLPDGSVEMKFADSTNVAGVDRRDLARPHRRHRAGRSHQRQRLRRRRDRRALRAGQLDRHLCRLEEVLRDPSRQLRPDPACGPISRSSATPSPTS